MSGCDQSRLADALLPAVLEAGRVQMRLYRSGTEVFSKHDSSPVTDADRLSEEIIVKALETLAPGVAVIAEEAASAGTLPAVGKAFFLVDPLDGTKEFIQGRGEFTINIALVEDGCPVFGIVYAPALSQFFATTASDRAVGATLDPQSTAARVADIPARPIEARVADNSALVALASRSHLNPETRDWLSRYAVASYKQAGSSLKFCAIASGEADVYPRLGPTCEWDTAAGHAVLAAAGGRVTTLDGAPLTYGKSAARYLNPSFVAWGRGRIEPTAR